MVCEVSRVCVQTECCKHVDLQKTLDLLTHVPLAKSLRFS